MARLREYSVTTCAAHDAEGLPLAYNKDMQEDKEAVFDAADTAGLRRR